MAKKILVIDDEPDILALAAVRLERLGYEIIQAVDAEEAFDILQKITPDLILLDLVLPKMQGDELCKKLKSSPKFKHIPIILFTASVRRTGLPADVKTMGADECILKPFVLNELDDKVKKFIG